MHRCSLLTGLAWLLLSPFAVAQNVPPPGMAAEASQPFSFFLVPSDEIGFKDCPMGFQVTYDGAINNGFGELDLSVNGEPLTNRVRTFYKGYLPVLRYSMKQGDVNYLVQIVGAPWHLDPRENLVAYIRIIAKNEGNSPSKATLNAVYGPRGSTARCDLPCRSWYRDKFMDASSFQNKKGVQFHEASGQEIENGHLVLCYSPYSTYLQGPTPVASPSQSGVSYSLQLNPGQRAVVDLRMPFVPIDTNRREEVARVEEVNFDKAFSEVVAFWNDLYSHATEIDVPDPKVANTVRSSLAYDLIARDIEADGKHFTQTVNKFQYHDFYMRDTSFISQSYEMLNLPDVARTTVEHYVMRDASGNVTGLRHNMPDDWGQSLWALGSYLKFSNDKEYAKEIESAIAPHLDNFEKATSTDPLGLWPVAGPYDNELLNGHYTSHDLWALLGLREAMRIAKMAGNQADYDRAKTLYDQFDKHFLDKLAEITATDEGYVPPGMDDPSKGNDWENASAGVYPFHVLDPFDPRTTATVNMERNYKYREGIMTYGPNAWAEKQKADQGRPADPQELHDYCTFQVTETSLAREEQEKVVEDLYSVLVHTSSTNGGFECSIAPWGDRNPGGNFPPHGWFAARYNELVRNMLVREWGEDLHLASALAPDWVKPGQVVSIKRAATEFGLLGYSIHSRDDGAEVKIDGRWRQEPHRLLFHVPWFVKASSARADGSQVPIVNGVIELPSSTHEVQIRWTWISRPDLSYDRAVQLWLQKAYEPKPGEDRDHLFSVG